MHKEKKLARKIARKNKQARRDFESGKGTLPDINPKLSIKR